MTLPLRIQRLCLAFAGLGLVAALALPLAAQPAGETTAFIRAALLKNAGSPLTSPSTLLVQGGKIVAVGDAREVKIPAGAKVVDLKNQIVIPGLVVAETTLAERGRDDVETLTPQLRAIDGFDFYGDHDAALSGGVTTVQASPGARRLMPGQGTVVKLAGPSPERRTLKETESLRVLLGEAFKNPPRIYEPPVGAVSVEKPLEPTRAQLGGGLAGAMSGLRLAFGAARDEAAKPENRRAADPMLRALVRCVSAKQPLRVTAPGAADVRAAFSLAREFKLKLILVDVAPNALTASEWAEAKELVAGVVVNPGLRPGAVSDVPLPDPEEAKARSVGDLVRDLRAAGIKCALRPADDADLKEMLFLGGTLVSQRVPQADVLKMLTEWPAEMLGVESRVGSLAPGKDADFLVLSGDPFGARTQVREVFVGGASVWRAPAKSAALVVKALSVVPGAGGTPIPRGQVLVENGKIRAVGREVSAPLSAEVRDFPNGVVVPGFLDLGTGLGFGGPVTQPVPVGTKLGERLVSADPVIALARQGGVTTALFASPGNNVGPVIAFKLGETPRLLKEPVALKAGLAGNLTQAGESLRGALRAGKAYADGWSKYDADQADYLKKKAEWDELKKKLPAPAATKPASSAPAAPAPSAPAATKPEEKKPEAAKDVLPPEPRAPAKPQLAEALEPYRALFAQKIPLFVEARRADAIKLAVAICRDEFPVRLILVGGDDAHRLLDLLEQKQVAVAAGPTLVRTVEREQVNLPQALANRDLKFGFLSNATTGVKTLPWAVRFAVRQGLAADDALCAFTACPAELLGLSTVGALANGKDADLVVLSGPPFAPNSRVLAVMIDGQWVYHEAAAEANNP